ncbi:HAD family hydrolase [Streptomyces sp. Isolate_219]|uniref:HAD family hydrolase n=1 Tax=Streptomyces sp. Isolate_219 TaxID=2950110 RepID=UPI0021C89FFB|nr:HAD hydrolase-like protein [Streptomyces sp. Isolate_219]MCR8575781.1 HAD hydrolase-like protein [Streptomyces sp. Isolate_219]
MLFDLDGVLLDSRDAMLATLAGVATASLGRRITVADLPPDALTTPRVEVLAALGVADPDGLCKVSWDPALATASATTLFPGVLEGLMAIKDAGMATGLVTLQTRTRMPWLLPPAVLALLDVTVCREDAEPKPAPDGILLALARLAAAPHDAVFIGDTLTDQAAAFTAGVAFAGAGWGYAGPDELAEARCPMVLTDPSQIGPGLLDLAVAGRAPQRVSAPAR